MEAALNPDVTPTGAHVGKATGKLLEIAMRSVSVLRVSRIDCRINCFLITFNNQNSA